MNSSFKRKKWICWTLSFDYLLVAALMRMITVQPQLATDKGYLRRMVKYASNRGVTDQWISGRVHGFPPEEGLNSDGNRSITERQFRTVVPIAQ